MDPQQRSGPRPAGTSTHPNETEFGMHEMFFSITDQKGIIKTGNDVFVRVSGYSKDEMVGRPHNLVRHPDMPRIVFKQLWDEIGAGRPIAAYVKNRSADGRFYWVMATVVPIPGGYLSIRIKPSSELFEVAKSIYPELRRVEAEIEGPNGLNRKEAMEASGARLGELLAGAGYDSYDTFMREAVLAETNAREVDAQKRRLAGQMRRAPRAGGHGDAVLEGLNIVDDALARLVLRLDDYVRLSHQLAEKAAFVRGLADDVRLFALNAIVIASKAGGRDGAAIGAVAAVLQKNADSGSVLFGDLGNAIGEATGTLADLLFPVAASRLQSEMLSHFVVELDLAPRLAFRRGDLSLLHGSLVREVAELVPLLNELDRRMGVLSNDVRDLRRVLGMMRALSLDGEIEAARMQDSTQFSMLFKTVRAQVETAWGELADLSQSVESFLRHDNAQELEAALARAGGAITDWTNVPMDGMPNGIERRRAA